jgi:hypothetical protein
MAVPRNSLRGFLTNARGALRSAIETNQKITFVIGNESAGEHDSCSTMALQTHELQTLIRCHVQFYTRTFGLCRRPKMPLAHFTCQSRIFQLLIFS